ncbi:flagellar biosynthetic protein FlhB [Novosphingobium sp. Rr 2-17]|uniref:flagellar biosynthesis protein FlhB n=1 Tax=Novosphingobium sp. Rr 2-17 TaxID=555793 RepID=UPI0002699220|nr:flagellar biosynthesis protein FlhB [Novosphingobium sp. Rr 2-17]EIZ78714.1 flagellar biosynthetic protein FlhB [Novosphingobium sp. Rr 2-17]
MAADKDQKTHEPTEKKLTDARAKGDIATATEMRHAVMFVAAVVVAGGMGSATLARIGPMLVRLWGSADDYRLDPDGAQAFATGVLASVASGLAPVLGLLFGCAMLILFVQGRPTLSWSRVKPNFSKLSPVAGFGRIFGKRALVEFAKTLAKCGVVITIATLVVAPRMVGLDQLIDTEPLAIAQAAGALGLSLVKAVALLVGCIAAFDFLYQRHAYRQRMMMSLQEVKDEHKQSEGDPKIKAKIRAIGMQRSRRRMMAAVPTASVIVTNPTHYAVALKYDHGAMAAPVVVAKGMDEVALKIREIAKAAGVPIVESPPLARALYASAALDRPIPTEHFKAVAEIIGYVLRLAQRRG